VFLYNRQLPIHFSTLTVGYSHNITQRKTEPPKFPRLE